MWFTPSFCKFSGFFSHIKSYSCEKFKVFLSTKFDSFLSFHSCTEGIKMNALALFSRHSILQKKKTYKKLDIGGNLQRNFKSSPSKYSSKEITGRETYVTVRNKQKISSKVS